MAGLIVVPRHWLRFTGDWDLTAHGLWLCLTQPHTKPSTALAGLFATVPASKCNTLTLKQSVTYFTILKSFYLFIFILFKRQKDISIRCSLPQMPVTVRAGPWLISHMGRGLNA